MSSNTPITNEALGGLIPCSWLEEKLFRCCQKLELKLAAVCDIEPAASTSIVVEIAAERKRQMEKEGYSVEHDNTHTSGELAVAAACYALNTTWLNNIAERELVRKYWPWELNSWKPKTPREDLIRAAALITAEIERIDRRKR